MLDTYGNVCQTDIITASVSGKPDSAGVVSYGDVDKTSFNHGGARPGAGRPPITSERPWQIEGISRATYYLRRKSKPPVAYATNIPRWSVISYFGQAEMSATAELSRIGYETYLPMVAIRRQDPVLASMWHTVRVPYFSGYGFIRITAIESREPILATRGVRELLRRPDGRPSWVPDAEVKQLRDNDGERLILPQAHAPSLIAGATVRVTRGAFAEHKGCVIQCDGVRTQVEIVAFGRPMPVWLDRSAVEVV